MALSYARKDQASRPPLPPLPPPPFSRGEESSNSLSVTLPPLLREMKLSPLAFPFSSPQCDAGAFSSPPDFSFVLPWRERRGRRKHPAFFFFGRTPRGGREGRTGSIWSPPPPFSWINALSFVGRKRGGGPLSSSPTISPSF